MKIFNLCFTGISGSGKTTIAKELIKKLKEKDIVVELIDGDETRKEIGDLFGHSHEERMKMNKINRLLAKYLNRNDVNTIIAIVAPFEKMRTEMKNYFQESYIEVYIKCSYETCAKRDVKGYYKLQQRGELENLNGSDDIYEEPTNPDVIINTEKENVATSVNKILSYLKGKGYGI